MKCVITGDSALLSVDAKWGRLVGAYVNTLKLPPQLLYYGPDAQIALEIVSDHRVAVYIGPPGELTLEYYLAFKHN